MRDNNQLLISKEWLNRVFDVSVIMELDNTGARDFDMIKLQQQVIA